MVIFNSYVKLPEGICFHLFRWLWNEEQLFCREEAPEGAVAMGSSVEIPWLSPRFCHIGGCEFAREKKAPKTGYPHVFFFDTYIYIYSLMGKIMINHHNFWYPIADKPICEGTI